ncbi:MAG TPA: magnesium transporter [Chloroflexi bacterium]|nr:magnesium transporter [Chloroflexota bacterium]
MTDNIDQNESLTEAIQEALEDERFAEASATFSELHPADQAEIFNALEDEQQDVLLELLDISTTADLFDELEDDETLEAAENLSTERLADVLDEMDPDEAADLLGDLPPQIAEEALAQMDEAEDVLPLLGYADKTAGGRATTDYIAMRPYTTAQQAIQFLREVAPENDVPYYLFVIDRQKRLVGVSGLRELVIAKPDATMQEIMDTDVVSVSANADQEEAARIMRRYDLSALPVVDADNRLLGVISHDDILDVIADEATEDIYALSQVSDADIDPNSTIGQQIRGRLPWLIVNSFASLFAAWVISNFGELITQVALLAFFQSVVAGLGGSSAGQDVAMMVRALALDKVSKGQARRILIRQVLVGFLQGSAIGLLVGIGIGLWQQNPFLGLVVGLALIFNMLVAATVGTLVPLVLHALKKDPALASSVLVTATTDAMGFMIYLSLASIFLARIQQYIPI